MAAAMAAARGGVDGRGRTRGRRWRGQGGESMDEAGRGGGEEEKTVALCGAGNLASTRCAW
jgi:phosphoglycerate dehydrogenase-like enzyme